MKWFKFYGQDYLSDPKILALSACERSCWITLLSYGSVNDNGMITFLDEEQLMAQSGLSPIREDWKETKGVLEKLKKLKMITLDNEVITILNWKKRQEISLTGYERVKKYREKKRLDNADDNAKITSEENRREEIRIDKNIVSTPSQVMKKFISEEKMQTHFIYELSNKYLLDPNFLKDEVKKFITYWTEPNKSGTRQRWETEKTFELTRRLSNWFNRIQKFENNKPKTIIL